MAITDIADWNLKFNETRTATTDTEGKITIPIAGIDIPITFSSPILIVRFLINEKYLQSAGTIAQVLPVPFDDNISLTGDIFPLFPNLNRILKFTAWSNYHLAIQPDSWIKKCKITIWEYTGDSPPSIELLTQIQLDVSALRELIGG